MPLRTIFLVDDDNNFRRALREVLENAGFAVREAETGRTALISLRELAPDLVVTDIIMPDIEGIELIRELKREIPAVPIIAVSGGGRIGARDVLEMARRMGADRAFQKPFRYEPFLRAVRELLRGRPY